MKRKTLKTTRHFRSASAQEQGQRSQHMILRHHRLALMVAYCCCLQNQEIQVFRRYAPHVIDAGRDTGPLHQHQSLLVRDLHDWRRQNAPSSVHHVLAQVKRGLWSTDPLEKQQRIGIKFRLRKVAVRPSGITVRTNQKNNKLLTEETSRLCCDWPCRPAPSQPLFPSASAPNSRPSPPKKHYSSAPLSDTPSTPTQRDSAAASCP
jgi:hypothetical protein